MDKKKVVLVVSGVIVSLAVIGAIIFCILLLNKAKQTSSNMSIEGKENNEDAIVIDISSEFEPVFNEEEELTEEEKEQEKNNKYFIRVNYEANVVNIYTQDDEGKFTKPYKAMVCSTGSATPDGGTYKTSEKGRWGYMVGNVWAQYYVRICGSILFHSVPYTAKNNHSLEYWEYDKLGTTASAGCVRLTTKDAKWIYDNCSTGTEVEFYADSNPGPFGKPTAKKISDDEDVRNWDPTDPDPANPWKDYVPEIKDSSETNKNETKTNNKTNTTNLVKKNTTNTTNTTNNINTTKNVNKTVSNNTVSTQNKVNTNTQNNTVKTTNTSQSSNTTKTTNTTQGTNNTNTTVSNKTNTTNTTTTQNKTETKNEVKPQETENKTEQTPPEPEKKEPEKLPEQQPEQPSNTTTPPSDSEEPTTDE